MSTPRNEPSLIATLYTENIHPAYFTANSLRLRGYYRDEKPWAIVDVGGVQLTAVDGDGIAGMLRLADALRDAVALARQAEQDENLADLAVTA